MEGINFSDSNCVKERENGNDICKQRNTNTTICDKCEIRTKSTIASTTTVSLGTVYLVQSATVTVNRIIYQ